MGVYWGNSIIYTIRYSYWRRKSVNYWNIMRDQIKFSILILFKDSSKCLKTIMCQLFTLYELLHMEDERKFSAIL